MASSGSLERWRVSRPETWSTWKRCEQQAVLHLSLLLSSCPQTTDSPYLPKASMSKINILGCKTDYSGNTRLLFLLYRCFLPVFSYFFPGQWKEKHILTFAVLFRLPCPPPLVCTGLLATGAPLQCAVEDRTHRRWQGRIYIIFYHFLWGWLYRAFSVAYLKPVPVVL